MPRITFTPPPLTIDGGTINSPPCDPLAYAEFLRVFLEECGALVGDYVELWNEWNLDTDWKQELDPGYRTFMTMIAAAALVAHHFGKKAVLGGMTGVSDGNARGLVNFAHHGLFRYIDVVGFHDLRGTWSDDVPSAAIPQQVRYVRQAVTVPAAGHPWLAARLASGSERAPAELRAILERERFRLRPEGALPSVWLTEYGFPVVCPENRFATDYLEDIQTALFAYAVDCLQSGAIERVYWYTYQDYVGESVRKHTTGWEDVLQFYYGDTCERGTCRLLGSLLDAEGPDGVHRYVLARGMFPLVDAASLGRMRPHEYRSNNR